MSDHDSEMSTTSNSGSTNQEPELIIIHQSGNLDLIVGDKSLPTCKRLRVWTGILQFTSKVFAAMISPTYAEGQQSFSPGSPGVIELAHDDPSAMMHLCQILHMNFSQNLLEHISSSDILKMYVVADKYDCTSAVGPALSCRLQHLAGDNCGYTSDFELLAASWLLQNERCFRCVSKKLITEYSKPVVESIRNIESEIFPAELACEEVPWISTARELI